MRSSCCCRICVENRDNQRWWVCDSRSALWESTRETADHFQRPLLQVTDADCHGSLTWMRREQVCGSLELTSWPMTGRREELKERVSRGLSRGKEGFYVMEWKIPRRDRHTDTCLCYFCLLTPTITTIPLLFRVSSFCSLSSVSPSGPSSVNNCFV